MQANDRFLKKTFNRYLVPTMFSVLGGTVNVLFDGILVGKKLGPDGLAAVNLCMPLYLLQCPLGSLVGAGGALLSAAALGRSEEEKSRSLYQLSNILLLAVGLLFTAGGLLMLTPLVRFMSGGSGLDGLVRPYAGIIVAGTLPKLLLYIPFNYLRLDGRHRAVLLIMLTMTWLNIFGDWYLMFVLDMGIDGAALASVLSTLAACVAGYCFLQSKKSAFRFGGKIAPLKNIGPLLSRGSASAMNNLFSAVRVLALNFILLQAGGSPAVAVFAVVNSISEFSLCIISGIPQTASPMIGIYAAERNNTGIRILARRQVRLGLLFTGVFGAGAVVFAAPIGRCFGTGESLYLPLACLGVSLLFAVVNSIMTDLYNCVEHLFLANLITLCRLVVYTVLFAFLLPLVGWPVWLFLPAAELFSALTWVAAAGLYTRKNSHLSPLLLLDETWEKEGRVLDFSVQTDAASICDASEKISDFCQSNALSVKQAMRVSLAIEELMVVLRDRCMDGCETESMDLRAFAVPEEIGIRIRCAGKAYNPVDPRELKINSEEFMGISMIMGMVQKTRYQRTFGVNSILVIL